MCTPRYFPQMGYANPDQVAAGVHMRQYARSFIVDKDDNRVLFINIDACMGSSLLKSEVSFINCF